ncbi:hypothetical protein [Streptomyces montanisoli]|uniref:Uncharacterized protein n=1 Tax=Streptomyces montanisoli TaxID=2798581 RepID=A0A940MD26_9ACTN|nr:hypothetical protein [Streptomyces montanisoli]MBP0458156.1 hypothetical protein [Streptomyces montanisoli]
MHVDDVEDVDETAQLAAGAGAVAAGYLHPGHGGPVRWHVVRQVAHVHGAQGRGDAPERAVAGAHGDPEGARGTRCRAVLS